MSVDTERAVAKGTYGTETVYFCSLACKKTFESRGLASNRVGPAHHP